MFTGLIEEKGTVTKIVKGSKSAEITIQGQHIFTDLKIGDSVCTNGACLTVTDINDSEFTVDVMSESLRASTLKNLQSGNHVNLERALKVSDRLGGHIVSGHVDGIAKIIGIERDGIAIKYSIMPDKPQMRYIINKGSVTIDGISLTVSDIYSDHFVVSVIPHTAANTTLPEKKAGDMVNLETDTIAKYIERMLNLDNSKDKKSSINIEELINKGF
jgi:riboflavin synthase